MLLLFAIGAAAPVADGEVVLEPAADGRALEIRGAGLQGGGGVEVRVTGSVNVPPVAGEFDGPGGALVFRPRFPFAPGVMFRVTSGGVDLGTFSVPLADQGERARVEAVYPSADVLPENLLKFYIHFNRPMARGDAYRHVRLVDEDSGQTVDDPFLELGEELWDPEGKRFTLFFDPGRVKRGLKPHEEAGPVLGADRRYRLEVGAGWNDAAGRELVAPFVKKFRTTTADYAQPNIDDWAVTVPEAGTRAPLRVDFTEPLDHALATRVLEVEGVAGQPALSNEERSWTFTPDQPWPAGPHPLAAGSELEDLAGNSLRKAFETPEDGPVDARPRKSIELGEPARRTFQVGAPREGSRADADEKTSADARLPLRWDATTGDAIAWKSELPGDGASSPVATGSSIFLTAQTGSGPVARFRASDGDGAVSDDGPVTFHVLRLDAADGHVRWEKSFPATGDLEAVHPLHNLATPTCATDGTLVVAWFATGQLFCFDFDGALLWSRHLGEELHPFRLRWGHASSPVLHDGKLYLLCDHDPAACLLVLDPTTGDEVWRADRGRGLRSYSTPVVAAVEDRTHVIVNSNHGIDAYDAQTGDPIWSWKEFCKVPVPIPQIDGTLMVTSRGYTGGPLMALDLRGLRGEVPQTAPRWRWPSRAPYVSSPCIVDDLVVLSDEEGRVLCAELETGELVWAEKLGTRFWSTPLAAGGMVYLLDESGETVVLEPGSAPNVVARNPAPGEARGSPTPTPDGRRLLIRTTDGLFCVE